MKDERLGHVSGMLWEGAHVELDASWWVLITHYGEPSTRPWTTPIFSGKCWGQHVSGEWGFPETSPVTSFPFLLPWLLPGRNKCPRILDTPHTFISGHVLLNPDTYNRLGVVVKRARSEPCFSTHSWRNWGQVTCRSFPICERTAWLWGQRGTST